MHGGWGDYASMINFAYRQQGWVCVCDKFQKSKVVGVILLA